MLKSLGTDTSTASFQRFSKPYRARASAVKMCTITSKISTTIQGRLHAENVVLAQIDRLFEFDAQRPQVGLGRAGGQHQIVGDRGLGAHVEHDQINGLLFVEGAAA